MLAERLIGFEDAERMWLGSSLTLEMIVDIGSEIAQRLSKDTKWWGTRWTMTEEGIQAGLWTKEGYR